MSQDILACMPVRVHLYLLSLTEMLSVKSELHRCVPHATHDAHADSIAECLVSVMEDTSLQLNVTDSLSASSKRLHKQPFMHASYDYNVLAAVIIRTPTVCSLLTRSGVSILLQCFDLLHGFIHGLHFVASCSTTNH